MATTDIIPCKGTNGMEGTKFAFDAFGNIVVRVADDNGNESLSQLSPPQRLDVISPVLSYEGRTIDKTSDGTAVAKWQIVRVATIGDLTTRELVNQSLAYDQVWDDRATIFPVPGTPGAAFTTHDFNAAVAVAKDVTVNHDFTVALGQIVELHQLNIDATDISQFELQIGDGALVEVFSTVDCFDIFVPLVVPFQKPITVAGTVDGLTIRIAKTNLSNQTQDLFSKMILVVR